MSTTQTISQRQAEVALKLEAAARGEITLCFRDANLEGVRFPSQDLHRVDFTGANLRGADFSKANLSDADFTNADLRETNLSFANLCDANLVGANLAQANLSRADLCDANFTRANLYRADLSGADLGSATMICADLTRANISGTQFDSVDLAGAVGLVAVSLGAIELLVSIADRIVADRRLLRMSYVHCGTTHCGAGWVCTLDPVAAALEKVWGWNFAACMACPIPEFTSLFNSGDAAMMEFLLAVAADRGAALKLKYLTAPEISYL